MNEKIKKTFRAMTSAALAGAFVVSSVIGGGADSFVSPAVVSAAENSEDELTAGIYTVPLIRQVSESDSTKFMTSPLHYYARAILSIDENGSQTVTIGVENWSLYECFIPKKQTDTVDGTRYLPSIIFDESNTNNFTNFSFDSYKEIIDNNNDNYNLGDQDTKFGDITVDTESAKELDVAYVTFEVNDYKKSFSFTAWLNTPFYDSTEHYESDVSFYLDEAGILKADEIYNGIAGENLTHALTLSSNRSTLIYPINMANRCYVNYNGTVLTKGVFDSSIVTKQEDNTYLAKYHVNPNGFQNKPTKPVQYYCDFKILNSVTHPLNKEDYYSYDEWDTFLTGSYTDLIIDEEGYISVVYDSVQEALMGKYIFFDCGSTTDNTIYYCMPCISLTPIETFSIIDDESGAYVVTDTSVCSKTTKLKVEKNKEISLQESNTGDTVSASDKWNCGLYKDTNWYTFNLTDENDNILSNRLVNLYVPCDDNSYVDIWRNGDHLMNSEQLVGSCTIKDGYLVYKNIPIDDLTIAVMGINDKSDICSITDDGIYTAEAFFLHTYRDATPSMADSGLIKKVYVVVENGTKKMYFKSKAVSTAINDAYIGDVHCNNISVSGEIYDDSISYTSFKMNDNELAGNMDFDAYTEYADIEGGILTLMDESYLPDHKVYDLAVSAPIMTRLDNPNASYEDIKKDGLCVWLALTNLEKCSDDVTMQTIIDDGYGYQPSALLRKIRQAEIKSNIGKNTASDSTAFADAYAVYNKADATSQEIEAAINALDATATDKLPSAKVTGYSLTAKEDFGLHLFVDLGYDAQNDANAAVKFNIGGTEQSIAVSDATFVEGKGYEFTLDVPAKAMFDEITAEIVLSEGAEIIGDANLGTYSVAGYLNDYIASDDNTLDALAQATLTYGAYADKFFNGSTDAELADVSAVTIDDVAQYKHNINVTEEGIDFVGAALTLESKTSVKLYFKVDEDNFYDIADFAFTVNGNKAEPERNGDYYYITVPKLTAGELAKAQTFTVNDAEFSYSPFSYVYAALADSDAEKEADLINLVKALYLYGVEAGKVA